MQIHEIDLSMDKLAHVPQEVVVRVGDRDSQVIRASLTSANKPYKVDENAEVKLQIKRADGGLVRAAASRVSDSVYMATVPGQAFIYHGVSRLAYFAVYNDDGTIETSQDFRIIVLPGTTEEVAVDYFDAEINELTRKFSQATTDVVGDEAARVRAEEARAEAEKQRETAEQKREAQEETRQSQEATRKSQEEGRVSAESSRVTTEEQRVEEEGKREEAEQTRQDQEQTRQEQERSRVDAENAREEAEQGRADAEQERVEAEAKRAEAESSRVEAEDLRVEAEEKREQYVVKLKGRVDGGEFNGSTFTPSWDGTTLHWENDGEFENPPDLDLRGSRWFTGTDVTKLGGSVPGEKDYDLYLNTETADVFQFHGGSWEYQMTLEGGGGSIEPSVALSCKITSTPADGESYKDGETVTFEVTAMNDSIISLYDLAIAIDTGELDLGGQSTSIDELRPGSQTQFAGSYDVTEADYGKQIRVFVTAQNGLVEQSAYSDYFALPEKNVSLKATKSITSEGTGDEGEYYTWDTVRFDIALENNGNITLHDLTVAEALSGCTLQNGEGYELADGQAKITTFAPGKTATVKASYVVQESDLGKQGIINNANITADETSTTATAPGFNVSDELRTLQATKTITNQGSGSDNKFIAGDEIEYDIRVTNAGGNTYTDVMITEQLDGCNIQSGDGYSVEESGAAKVASMSQHDSVTIKAKYPIKESDLGNKNLTNSVQVQSGVTSLTISSPAASIDDIRRSLTGSMSITSKPSGEEKYWPGDHLVYEIKVENNGNITATNVTVEQTLEGCKFASGIGYSVDENVTIDSLAPNASVTIKAQYDVEEKDIDQTLSNSATIKWNEVQVPLTVADVEVEAVQIQPVESKIHVTPYGTRYGHGHGYAYNTSDTITFVIPVWNTTQEAISNIDIEITEPSGVSLTSADVAPADPGEIEGPAMDEGDDDLDIQGDHTPSFYDIPVEDRPMLASVSGTKGTISSLEPGKYGGVVATYKPTTLDMAKEYITLKATVSWADKSYEIESEPVYMADANNFFAYNTYFDTSDGSCNIKNHATLTVGDTFKAQTYVKSGCADSQSGVTIKLDKGSIISSSDYTGTGAQVTKDSWGANAGFYVKWEYTVTAEDVAAGKVESNITISNGAATYTGMIFSMPTTQEAFGLNQYEWSQLAEMSKNPDQYENLVLQCKEITVGSCKLTVQLANTKLEYPDGTVIPGFVFEICDFSVLEKYNSSNTNEGGFDASALKTYLEGTYFNSLPSDLRAVIKSVKRRYCAKWNTAPVEKEYKIWPLTLAEVGADPVSGASWLGNRWQDEGVCWPRYLPCLELPAYNIYNPTRVKWRTQNNGSTWSAYFWWLGSPYSYTTSFWYGYGGGYVYYSIATNSYGVAPGFMI